MNAANESSPAPSLRRLPFLIRLAPPFINRVSAVLTSSENTGGISGLLYGVIESDFALVQVFRALPSRASGGSGKSGAKPSIQEQVEQLIATSKKDHELAGLSLLGWYSARSVSGLQAEDVEFHQKTFTEPNDIALIVKPEPPGEVSLELYTRTMDGVLSNEGHRWGSVRISCDSPVSSPVEVPMRAKIHDDFYMRAYQFADPLADEEPAPRWKDAFASTTKRAFELLKTVKPDDRAQAAASAKREAKEAERSKLESVPSTDYPLRDGSRDGPPTVATGGGAAAAPARMPAPRTGAAQPLDRENAGGRQPESAKVPTGDGNAPPAPSGFQPPAFSQTSEAYEWRVPAVTAQPQLAAPPPPGSATSNALALTSSQSSLPVSSTQALSPNLPARAPQYATQKEREIPWLAMAAVFAVTAGATFGFISLRSAHASGTLPSLLEALWPAPGLGLKLSNEGDRVQLSWNQNNPAVRTAGEASLEIYDGTDHRQVRLTARELANGSVLYRPNTDDVVFHLEVHGAQGQTASETMRVLGTSKPPILDVSQPSNAGQTAPDAKTRQENARITAGQLQLDAKNSIDPSRLIPIKAKSDRGQTQMTRSVPKPATAESAPPAAQPPANNTPPVTSPAVDAPAVQARNTAGAPPANATETNTSAAKTAVAENVLPPQTSLPPREIPTASSAAPTNTTPPAQPPKTEAPVNTPAPTGQASTPAELPSTDANPSNSQPLASYVAPRPLRQVTPNVKALPAGLGDTSGEVKVLVRVDESGRVVDAKIVEGTKSINSVVRNAALVAARQWTFEPASLRGRKIVSDHTILFQFHR